MNVFVSTGERVQPQAITRNKQIWLSEHCSQHNLMHDPCQATQLDVQSTTVIKSLGSPVIKSTSKTKRRG